MVGGGKLGVHLGFGPSHTGNRSTSVSLFSHVAFPPPQTQLIGDDHDPPNDQIQWRSNVVFGCTLRSKKEESFTFCLFYLLVMLLRK